MEKLVLLSLTLVTWFIYLVTRKSKQELQFRFSCTDIPPSCVERFFPANDLQVTFTLFEMLL